MSRLILPRRVRTATFAVLTAALFATPMRAADPTAYLPDGTMLVLSFNVRQLLQAPLVHGDEKAFKQATADATKALAGFGVDPAKDVDRIVLAVGEQLKAATTLILVEGRF